MLITCAQKHATAHAVIVRLVRGPPAIQVIKSAQKRHATHQHVYVHPALNTVVLLDTTGYHQTGHRAAHVAHHQAVFMAPVLLAVPR